MFFLIFFSTQTYNCIYTITKNIRFLQKCLTIFISTCSILKFDKFLPNHYKIHVIAKCIRIQNLRNSYLCIIGSWKISLLDVSLGYIFFSESPRFKRPRCEALGGRRSKNLNLTQFWVITAARSLIHPLCTHPLIGLHCRCLTVSCTSDRVGGYHCAR